MIVVATLLWDPNSRSKDFSTCYDESWVEKLYRGFRRNLTVPMRFICFTDHKRKFQEPDIQQYAIESPIPDYSTCIEPYRLGAPMILVGLDTVITGNCDHLADYCFDQKVPAYPLDPYHPERVCNGVSLVPADMSHIYYSHRGENDMDWIRRFNHKVIDKEFPNHVVSYKGHVKKSNLGDARIVYFHGREKPHELPHVQWIKEHWV